ncbi:MAG: hypothetical protein B6D41_12720 [Chloroflexi bacterium UTCFX4]|jgi:hypothetical protein|nr:MAG: hypothetical protein B6D41_12720 [Chloroflexi bacterium UTCFX4]
MSFPVEHHFRFDAQNKLDADDWLLIPRAQLAPHFALDETLAQELVQLYLETVAQHRLARIRVEQTDGVIRLRMPLNKVAIIFAEQETLVNAERAETSWRIAGGFLLAHRVNYGGRFYLGAEWQADALKLYSIIRRYPPRFVAYLGGKNGIALYDALQGRMHKQIQARYLRRAAAAIAKN